MKIYNSMFILSSLFLLSACTGCNEKKTEDPKVVINKVEEPKSTQKMQDYDLRYGVPLTVTDRAGNSMEYTLDSWGRPLTIRGPKEIADGAPFTIRYSYRKAAAGKPRAESADAEPRTESAQGEAPSPAPDRSAIS